MSCSSGNLTTVNVTDSTTASFVPASDSYPFEDPAGGWWQNIRWEVTGFGFGGEDITDVPAKYVKPDYVKDVILTVTYDIETGASKAKVTFEVDTTTAIADGFEYFLIEVTLENQYAGDQTADFCLNVNTFSWLTEGASTIWLGTPDSLNIAGGLVTSWTDLSPSGYDLDQNDGFSTIGTAPTGQENHASWGNALVLDSDEDLLNGSSPGSTFNFMDPADPTTDDAYLWVVAEITAHNGAAQNFLVSWYSPNSEGSGAPYFAIYIDPSDVSGSTTNIRVHFAGSPASNATGDLISTTYPITYGQPFLLEFKYEAQVNVGTPWGDATLYIDGTQADQESSDYVDPWNGGGKSLAFGYFSTATKPANAKVGLLKLDSAIPSAARLTAIRDYCRDNLGCTGIA